VLVVDLAALDVSFVPGSSPPRLRIRLDDAVVGLQQGAVSTARVVVSRRAPVPSALATQTSMFPERLLA